jgi:exopolyphosphatase/guanosine-5'-triphosphate,3'-diphosphate pyrophosphatase
MVATSATRDAANAADFEDMVVATLGIPPEVISGEEEAALAFAGAVGGLPAYVEPPHLVVDIGGGSTEFVVGAHTVQRSVSVDIGCVRITERHLLGDPPTEAEVQAARDDIDAAVTHALDVVDARDVTTVIGLAGSVTTVVGIALGLSRYDPLAIHHARASTADVAEIARRLLSMSRTERMEVPVMHPGRADVIGAGALILRTVLERAGAQAVVASEHDILDGICLSLRDRA